MKRFAELDGLRGTAAGMVVVTHLLNCNALPAGPLWDYLLGLASPGVDVFFALSGFLIGGILLDHEDDPALCKVFYARRFFRIVPIYLVLVASFVIAREMERKGVLGLAPVLATSDSMPVARYLLFIQGNFMAIERSAFPTWMVVTWSVGVEEQFYLCAPWAARTLRRCIVPVLCIALIVVCPIVRYWYLIGLDNLMATGLLSARADCLAWGILATWAIRDPGWSDRLRRHKKHLTYLVIILLSLHVMRATVPLPEIGWLYPAGSGQRLLDGLSHSIYAMGSAVVIVYVRDTSTSPLGWLLRSAPLRFSGAISYFVYLFHLPILFVCGLYFQGIARVAVFLAATIGLAVVSWQLFERPLVEFARQRFRYAGECSAPVHTRDLKRQGATS